MSDALEFVAFIAGCIAVAIVIGVGSVTTYNLIVDKPACAAYGVVSEQQTFYSLGTSCLVKRDGEWVSYAVAVGHKEELTLKQK